MTVNFTKNKFNLREKLKELERPSVDKLVTKDENGAYIDTIRGTTKLESIDSVISDTAVDIFIYDTSKDSDGGAWRHRTSHTSWYNEELNTTTRGSRREFPAVAVIVAETNQVTIYDGDDPDLPMWMVFNRSSSSSSSSWTFLGGTPDSFLTTTSALNGLLVVGTNQTSSSGFAATVLLNFLSETVSIRYLNGSFSTSNSAFVYRNSVQSFNGSSSGAIVSGLTNDVVMTVLPNAPIDDTTGLPIPTIAVATNGGVSVIKDDGTVSDLKRASTSFTSSVQFTDNNSIMLVWGHASDAIRHINHYSYADWQTDKTDYDQSTGYHELPQFGSGALQSPLKTSATGITSGVLVNLNGQNRMSAKWDNYGLKLADLNDGNRANGMVAHIRPEYNSGWMHGSIKGAFLADTDDTNVTSSNLMSGATYNSSERITSYSYTNGSDTLVIDDDENTVDGYVNLTLGGLSPSTKYVISYTSDNTYTPTPGFNPHIGNTSVGTSYFDAAQTGTGKGSLTFTTASSGDPSLVMYSNYSGGNLTYTIQLRLAEEDRSVNDKGLQVYGTITKSPVATGAELVSYGNFESNSAILVKPYDSGTQFGTGDFSISYWLYDNDNTQDVRHFCLNQDLTTTSETTEGFNIGTWNTNIRFLGAGGVTQTGVIHQNNTWSHIHLQRKSGTIYLYINGTLKFSTSYTNDVNTSKGCTIGNTGYIGNGGPSIFGTHGKLSLVRLSASAPSPEQIKKIYEDEKVLFQENAKCTLYGSSDAVTALAYDEVTERLHVGTSSGRSEFQGLCRINNTIKAVTTDISAYDSFVVEQ